MTITWVRKYLGSYHGHDETGRQVAQVGHVIGPAGSSLGWSLHLVQRETEEFDYFPSKEAAQAAAEAALDDG